jgi:ACS family sodium-dependent inorganic phosphate cotransporter-like MFS transporter 6/7/8
MIHFCGVIFYAMFASGELQPWAEPMAGTVMIDAQGNPMIPGVPPAAIGTTVIASGATTTTIPGAVDPMNQWGASAAGAGGVMTGGNNPFGQPNGTTAAGGYPSTDPYAAASWNDPSAGQYTQQQHY